MKKELISAKEALTKTMEALDALETLRKDRAEYYCTELSPRIVSAATKGHRSIILEDIPEDIRPHITCILKNAGYEIEKRASNVYKILW
jgi:hypothetical protein